MLINCHYYQVVVPVFHPLCHTKFSNSLKSVLADLALVRLLGKVRLKGQTLLPNNLILNTFTVPSTTSNIKFNILLFFSVYSGIYKLWLKC